MNQREEKSSIQFSGALATNTHRVRTQHERTFTTIMSSPTSASFSSSSFGSARLSKSGSGSPTVHLVNKGDFINPVFTITPQEFAAACNLAATKKCYPTVRQKSKSSGASPQRYQGSSPGNSGIFLGEEFINIITSSESVDRENDNDLSIYEDYAYGSRGHSSSHSHSHSNPYLHTGNYYGSNSKLLQVPSSSSILYYQSNNSYDLSPEDEARIAIARQQRSSSITVPLRRRGSGYGGGYYGNGPHPAVRCTSELFIARRRCSSSSPQRGGVGCGNVGGGGGVAGVMGYVRRRSSGASGIVTPRVCVSNNTSPNRNPYAYDPYYFPPKGNQPHGGYNPSSTLVKRRRSSSQRRPSFTIPASSSSSSSLEEMSKYGLGEKKRRKPSVKGQQGKGTSPASKKQKDATPHPELPRQRTLSMPNCMITTSTTTPNTTKDPVDPNPPKKSKKPKTKSKTKTPPTSSRFYDVVIIGTSNVGKTTLSEFFKQNNPEESDLSKGTPTSPDDDNPSPSTTDDQGIGMSTSEDDEDAEEGEVDNDDLEEGESSSSSCEDQDLMSKGKPILYRPQNLVIGGSPTSRGGRTGLPSYFNLKGVVTRRCNSSTPKKVDFGLRIFRQQTSAVNYLYKYDAVLILYSVTDRDSFEFARKALAELVFPLRPQQSEKERNRKVVILVGNKSDLERSRVVSTLEGRSLAVAYDVKFIEISSSLGVSITKLQSGLVTQIYLRRNLQDLSSSNNININNKAKIPPGNNSNKKQSYSKKESFLMLMRLKKKKDTSSHGSSNSSLLNGSSSSPPSSVSGGGGGSSSSSKGGASNPHPGNHNHHSSKPLSPSKMPLVVSLKLAQKLIDRVIQIKIGGGSSGGGGNKGSKTKSCLDLQNL